MEIYSNSRAADLIYHTVRVHMLNSFRFGRCIYRNLMARARRHGVTVICRRYERNSSLLTSVRIYVVCGYEFAFIIYAWDLHFDFNYVLE